MGILLTNILPGAGPRGPGAMTWLTKTGAYNVNAWEGILADTSTVGAWTLTLPASPAVGDTIGIIDAKGSFASASLTIDGNGSLIAWLTSSLTCNKVFLSFDLIYAGTAGWVIKPSANSSFGATKGYFTGGSSGAIVVTTDKVTFSTDVTGAQTTANLTTATTYLMALKGNTAGYVAGGFTGADIVIATAGTITYSTDIYATATTANLSVVRYGGTGLSEGSSKGYFLGGATERVTYTESAVADKITFSSSTRSAQTSANLSLARKLLVGINAALCGYALGGATTAAHTATSVADKLIFSTDITAASTASALPVAAYTGGTTDGIAKGYIAGGYTGAFSKATLRITYSTDVTTAASTANLSTGKYSLAGVGNGNDKGYMVGGYTGAYVYTNTAEKIAFSTEVTTAQTTANLSSIRAQFTSLANQVVVAWS